MEMFQLVDRNGRPTGQASRQECHGNPRLIHLVVHLHVFDPAGRLYLQKRSMRKDTNPGLWDTSVGGHVSAGEMVEDALVGKPAKSWTSMPGVPRFSIGT